MIDPADVTTPPPPATGRVFGYELRLNLSYCDPAKVTKPGALLEWGTKVAEILGLETYGQPWLDHFGPDPDVLADTVGWTVFVPITTSNLIGRFFQLPPGDMLVHANDGDLTAFLNIFFCAREGEGEKKDLQGAIDFTIRHFGAGSAEIQDFTVRRAPKRGQLSLTRLRPHGAAALGVTAVQRTR